MARSDRVPERSANVSSLSIKSRMLFVFAVIAVVQAAIAAIGLRGVSLSNADLAEVYQDRLVPVSLLARINDLMHVSIEQLTIAVIARPGPRDVQKYVDRVESNLGEIDNLVQDYAKRVSDDAGRKQLAEWTASRNDLIGKAIRPAIADLKTQAFDDAEDTILGVAVKQFATVQRLFDTIAGSELRNAERTHQAAEQRYSVTRYLTIGAVVLALSLCAMMAFYVTRSISGPLGAMTSAMRRLAQGDLEIAIPATARQDEIGHMAEAVQVFKQNAIETERLTAEQTAARAAKEQRQAAMERLTQDFGASVSGVMTALAAATGTMVTAAGAMSEAAAGVHHQATGTAERAVQSSQDLTSIAAAIEQMTASVDEITRQVASAAQVARAASDRATANHDMMRSLADATSRIGDAVRLIDGIAGQTNMLALNATIEAARAGEAGRGFAVVAGEVKALAQQTAKATAEIGAQIVAVRGAADGAIAAMNEIGSIVGSMDTVTAAISAAAEQQSVTTRDIAAKVQAVSAATNQAAQAMTEVVQTADTADHVSRTVLDGVADIGREANAMRGEIDQFLVAVRDDTGDRRRYESVRGNARG